MNTLKIATWNINGLASRILEIGLLMDEHDLDIVLITEAHCSASSSVKVRGCHTYITAHPERDSRGGTALVIRNTIKHYVLPEFQTNSIQATSVALPGSEINISAVYCVGSVNSPSTNKKSNPKITEEMFADYFNKLGDRFCAGGDYNAKHRYWGSRLIDDRGKRLKASIDTNNLIVYSTGISEPTYWPSDVSRLPDLVDFFIVNGLAEDCITVKPCADSSSDHTPVLLTINIKVELLADSKILHSKRTNWKHYREYINKNIQLRDDLNSKDEIDNAAMHITELIQKACRENTTEKGNGMIQNITREIKHTFLERRKQRLLWQESRRNARNIDKTKLDQVNKELQEMIENHVSGVINENLSAAVAAGSLREFIESFDQSEEIIPPLATANGTLARTSQAKADEFAISLYELYSVNQKNEDQVNQTFKEEMEYQPLSAVSVETVRKTIETLKDEKTAGIDLITVDVLRELPVKALQFLTNLFNGALQLQYFPTIWKVSLITMIHSDGMSRHKATSYRPISQLPVLSKLFERILLDLIISSISNDDEFKRMLQIESSQEHLKVQQVRKVYDTIKRSYDNDEYCYAVFLDIHHALDKLWRKALLHKVRTHLPQFDHILKTYMYGRNFQVCVEDALSKQTKIRAGLPQSSDLGHLLYMLYMVDFPESEGVTTVLFVDKIAILASTKNSEKAPIALQQALERINSWLGKWLVELSDSASRQVVFTKSRMQNYPCLKLSNQPLPLEKWALYLGVYFDRHLTWKMHIETTSKQVMQQYNKLRLLMKHNSKVSRENKIIIYNTVLKPIWMYGIQYWSNACASSISLLQMKQDTILQNIWEENDKININEIHKYLGFATIKEEIRVTNGTGVAENASSVSSASSKSSLLDDSGYLEEDTRNGSENADVLDEAGASQNEHPD